MKNINIGINGFGRIGKCIFLQLLEDNSVNINAININNLTINDIGEYINNDSIHHIKKYEVEILENNYIYINNYMIKIFNEKDAKLLNWKNEKVEYLFETTGAYLTTETAKQHDVDYLIMSAPPKDISTTPIYCFGVNENNYNKENIVSCASCTTNCIAPMLKFLNTFDIEHGAFMTVHSATSSQSIVDSANLKKRINRSVFNNIIPHTTGASSSLNIILPELKDKIIGTSVRVPVSNVSMIDLNVEFKNEISKHEIIANLEQIKDDIITTNNKNLVSSDFITHSTPTIIDTNLTFQIAPKNIKFTLWYDNEWSYSAQMIRLVKHMFKINNDNDINKIQNVNCKDKSVFLRVDFNCPLNNNNEISDYFRINSAMKTIKKIILDGPKRLIIATHFGRPKNKEEKYSTKLFIPYLEERLKTNIYYLKKGLDTTNHDLNTIETSYQESKYIYLMENVRFHDYETKNLSDKEIDLNIDIYCNEAFSCSHRNHKSITEIPNKIKCYGYCYMKEIEHLDIITKSVGCKIMAIIGGSKIEDKILMLKELSKRVSYIYITGNNINYKDDYADLFEEISKNNAEIIFTEDGFSKIDNEITYYQDINNKKICDVGPKSMNTLNSYIEKSDIVFWNGTLGITEDSFFKNGSESLLNMLNNSQAKVIIGGGDTAGFVNKYKNNFCHISTGGGASIDYISTGHLF
tara:strand:+ start:2032 stop:4107 length:2076 start_codon:yes stop_codon:yes gene_type:complete